METVARFRGDEHLGRGVCGGGEVAGEVDRRRGGAVPFREGREGVAAPHAGVDDDDRGTRVEGVGWKGANLRPRRRSKGEADDARRVAEPGGVLGHLLAIEASQGRAVGPGGDVRGVPRVEYREAASRVLARAADGRGGDRADELAGTKRRAPGGALDERRPGGEDEQAPDGEAPRVPRPVPPRVSTARDDRLPGVERHEPPRAVAREVPDRGHLAEAVQQRGTRLASGNLLPRVRRARPDGSRQQVEGRGRGDARGRGRGARLVGAHRDRREAGRARRAV